MAEFKEDKVANGKSCRSSKTKKYASKQKSIAKRKQSKEDKRGNR